MAYCSSTGDDIVVLDAQVYYSISATAVKILIRNTVSNVIAVISYIRNSPISGFSNYGLNPDLHVITLNSKS